MHFRNVLFVTSALCLAGASVAYAQSLDPAKYPSSTEWPTYGHDAGGTRFSPLKDITPANVANLKPAWVYHLKPEGYVQPQGGRGGGGGGRGAAAASEDDAPAQGPGGAGGGGGRGGRGGAAGGAAAAGAAAGTPPAGAPAGAPPGAAVPGRGGG